MIVLILLTSISLALLIFIPSSSKLLIRVVYKKSFQYIHKLNHHQLANNQQT
jgi:hypothetical protein